MSSDTGVLIASFERSSDLVADDLSKKIESIISNHAAKGWGSIGGPPISKILEASMTAMDSIYEAATEVLKKANALANETLAASVNEVLGRIEKTGLSRSNLTAFSGAIQKTYSEVNRNHLRVWGRTG